MTVTVDLELSFMENIFTVLTRFFASRKSRRSLSEPSEIKADKPSRLIHSTVLTMPVKRMRKMRRCQYLT